MANLHLRAHLMKLHTRGFTALSRRQICEHVHATAQRKLSLHMCVKSTAAKEGRVLRRKQISEYSV